VARARAASRAYKARFQGFPGGFRVVRLILKSEISLDGAIFDLGFDGRTGGGSFLKIFSQAL
jgi:hypothetical protein